MMLMVERAAELVEVADVVHANSFAEIDFRHSGFHAPGNVGHRNAAGAVKHQRWLDRFVDLRHQVDIQPALFFENAVSDADADPQTIHIHFGSKFLRLLYAYRWSSLFGIVRTLDDMADFSLHTDAQRANQIDNLLCAPNIFVERFVGVIDHH